LCAGAVAIAAAAWASTASAATLIGDYQLQGTLASSGAGPPLTDIGAGNSFQTDTVMGVQRQVLRFPLGNGLSMAPAGLGGGTGPYSEVVTFRFDDAVVPTDGGYARILDSTNGGSGDNGLYDHNGYLDYYDTAGSDNSSGTQLLADDTYATVAMSVSGGETRGYFNGSRVLTSAEANPVIDDTLRFFKDNGAEHSAGAVSCIRVYASALTDAEISGIGASPDCTPHPAAPPSHKKKCKKHKKKHKRSAESAKKKKCKKKKKKH
jgi:hypothetical protein